MIDANQGAGGFNARAYENAVGKEVGAAFGRL